MNHSAPNASFFIKMIIIVSLIAFLLSIIFLCWTYFKSKLSYPVARKAKSKRKLKKRLPIVTAVKTIEKELNYSDDASNAVDKIGTGNITVETKIPDYCNRDHLQGNSSNEFIAVKPRTMRITPASSQILKSPAPNSLNDDSASILTKKQRQNQKKAQKLKEVRQTELEIQAERFRRHKQDIMNERIKKLK